MITRTRSLISMSTLFQSIITTFTTYLLGRTDIRLDRILHTFRQYRSLELYHSTPEVSLASLDHIEQVFITLTDENMWPSTLKTAWLFYWNVLGAQWRYSYYLDEIDKSLNIHGMLKAMFRV
jgi:hypothetical protein